MKVLFIGGTGFISTAASRAAIAEGLDVTLPGRPMLPAGTVLVALPPGARPVLGAVQVITLPLRVSVQVSGSVAVFWISTPCGMVTVTCEASTGKERPPGTATQ